jgi:outer membrane protein assembly factor BamE (lipoprotein component of BamABCDE complex)
VPGVINRQADQPRGGSNSITVGDTTYEPSLTDNVIGVNDIQRGRKMMRSAATIGAVLLCLAFLGSGCVTATIGNQTLTQDRVSKIQKGVTTRDQVIELLGQPNQVQLSADGRHMLFYMGTQMKADYGERVFQAVPIIGAVVPTSDTQNVRRESLQIFIDASNVVTDYEFSDNTSETKTTVSAFGGHVEETTTSNIPAK